MKVLELLGEEFREIRRNEDVDALTSSLHCLGHIVGAGQKGYAPHDRQCQDIRYLLQLGLVRHDRPIPDDISQIRYYATDKGIEANICVEKIGTPGNTTHATTGE